LSFDILDSKRLAMCDQDLPTTHSGYSLRDDIKLML